MLFNKKISCSVSRVPSTSGIFYLNKSHYGWTQPSPKKRRPIGETLDLINFAFTQQCS